MKKSILTIVLVLSMGFVFTVSGQIWIQPDYCADYYGEDICTAVVTKCRFDGEDPCVISGQIPCVEVCGPTLAG